MDAKFLLQQCRVAEEVFFRGGKDLELRALIQNLVDSHNIQGGDLEPEVESESDSESESESGVSDEDRDVEPVDLETFMATGLQGGALETLDQATSSPWTQNSGYQVTTEKQPGYQDQYQAITSKDQAAATKIESMMDGLNTGLEDLEMQHFDEQIEQVRGQQIQTAQDRQTQELQRKVDLMDDPVWIQGGVEYLDYYNRTTDAFYTNIATSIETGKVLTGEGRLIPPEPDYTTTLAWMDRLRAYLGDDPYKNMPLERATQLYADCVAIIQTDDVLATLPVCPEWLRFQQFILDSRV